MRKISLFAAAALSLLAFSVDAALAAVTLPPLCMRLPTIERRAKNGSALAYHVFLRLETRCFGSTSVSHLTMPVLPAVSVPSTGQSMTTITTPAGTVTVPGGNGTVTIPLPNGSATVTNQSWSSVSGNGSASVQIQSNVHVETHTSN